jgi:serine/threonine-protein kinase
VSQETFGRYQLIKKLASGGMAQIYLARQLGLQGFEKLVVVKRILPHLSENEDFVTMFLDEARIAARLNHPNVVTIFDLGEQDDAYFIAMEHIHGDDVRRVWKQAERKGKRIPIPLVARIIADACAGLDYAHKRTDQAGRPLNIVHRDVSPQNILASFEGAVKVVDFGIAKAADQATVTKSGVLKGKYSYMSPEQARGKGVDSRTDVFALGVVFHELLTGARLFKRASDIETLNAVSECKVKPPSVLDPRVPSDLDPIVMKALAKSKDARYPDMRAMQQAIEEWLVKKKLASSSAHLAEFMKEIYAERLAREAEEDKEKLRLAEAAADASNDEGKAKRPAKGSKPPRTNSSPASRASGSDPTKPEGGRVSKSSSNSGAKPAPKQSGGRRPETQALEAPPMKAFQRPLAIGLIVGLAVAVLLLAIVALTGGAKARVTVVTAPPGALVRFNGQWLDCSTPCRLPQVAAGEYPLELSKTGYVTVKARIGIESSGDHSVPFDLEKLPPPKKPIVDVNVSFTSDPSGASVTIDGRRRGSTPVSVTLMAGVTVPVVFEFEGFEPVTRQVTVTTEKAEMTVNATLRRPTVEPEPPPAPTPKRERGSRRGGETGTVRFIATPYATVECPPYRFGETPFGDKTMAVGEYRCTFTNADLGKTQTRTVRVEANDVVRVKVSFQ